MDTLIRPLLDGPVDIVGDVHGEIDALSGLMTRLGYDASGRHPEGRRLVFVGDLCDRGPDSPAVIRTVADLVAAGRAQCVLGNHELNLLRGEQKHGNHWFFAGDHAHHERVFGRCARIAPGETADLARFFDSLPLALERHDLRIVHAAWQADAVAACRRFTGSATEAYASFDSRAARSPHLQRLKAEQNAERELHRRRLADPTVPMQALPGIAGYEAELQMSNPVRILTSGIERATTAPFFAAGKWRFVERVRWWEDYADAPVVVFGHYWRWWDPADHGRYSKGEPNLFATDEADGWHRNAAGREVAFCVDYSAGARFKERSEGRSGGYHGRLAALRWPERSVVFDGPPPA